MENNNPKLVFGLSPRATLVNGLILLAITSLMWSLSLVKQIPENIQLNAEVAKDIQVDIPWYIDTPLIFLGVFLLMTWTTFKFYTTPNFVQNKWKYDIAAILFVVVYSLIMKFVFLLLLLLFR